MQGFSVTNPIFFMSQSIDCIQIRSINWLYSAKKAHGTLMSRRFPNKRGGGALWITLCETTYRGLEAVLSPWPMWPTWISRPCHLRGLPLWPTTSAQASNLTTVRSYGSEVGWRPCPGVDWTRSYFVRGVWTMSLLMVYAGRRNRYRMGHSLNSLQGKV